MTRWLLTTLVLACLVTSTQPGHAQEAFGPSGFPVDPELLPPLRDRGFLYDVDSQFDLDVRETVERSWIRLEYLNWSVTDPGDVYLGAPLATFDRQGSFPTGVPVPNPGTSAFPVNDAFGARPGFFGFVPDLGDIRFQNNNGIRGTIGVPLQPFTFEGSAWYLGQDKQRLHFDPVSLGGQILIPTITYYNNGVLSNNSMTPFDSSYDAVVDVNLFGADTNLVLNPIQPGNPIQVQPLVGLKYLSYRNSLTISGVDVANGSNPVLGSSSENNTFGPQFGLRFSYDTKWVSFSFDPKVTFGINRHIDSVHSEQLFTSTELPKTVQEENTSFSPIFDMGVTSRVHLGPHLSVFVSYNLMAIGNQSTSWESIYYNAPAAPLTDPSAIDLDVRKKAVVTHGITIGGELRFR